MRRAAAMTVRRPEAFSADTGFMGRSQISGPPRVLVASGPTQCARGVDVGEMIANYHGHGHRSHGFHSSRRIHGLHGTAGIHRFHAFHAFLLIFYVLRMLIEIKSLSQLLLPSQ